MKLHFQRESRWINVQLEMGSGRNVSLSYQRAGIGYGGFGIQYGLDLTEDWYASISVIFGPISIELNSSNFYF